MIGELAAATALEHGEASGIEQVARLGRDAGGVERRMLEKPHQFAGPTFGDGDRARLHRGDGLRIGDVDRRDGPAACGPVGATEGRWRGRVRSLRV